jgi:hypothetical protein
MTHMRQSSERHFWNEFWAKLNLGQEADNSVEYVLCILPPFEMTMEFRSL